MEAIFVLVHSPALGPSTWRPVAGELTAAGHRVVVPSLLHLAAHGPPFWPRVVSAVREELGRAGGGAPIVLVAHSNAGLFVPLISADLGRAMLGSVFVDAALPSREGPTPAATPEALELLRPLAVEGRLPRWTDWYDEEQLAPLFTGAVMREEVMAEQPRLPLAYYEQLIPVPAGWDQHQCAYLQFSPPYQPMADDARARGWRVVQLHGAHLHHIVKPADTARILLELMESDVQPGSLGN